jgi:hypothetical protein
VGRIAADAQPHFVRSWELYCTTTFAQTGGYLHAAGELTLTVIGIPATKLVLIGPVSFAKLVTESVTLAVPLLTVMTGLAVYSCPGPSVCASTRVTVISSVGVSVEAVYGCARSGTWIAQMSSALTGYPYEGILVSAPSKSILAANPIRMLHPIISLVRLPALGYPEAVSTQRTPEDASEFSIVVALGDAIAMHCRGKVRLC